MSQQRLKDPHTSWTMLAFGTRAKLVKAILQPFLHVILTSASRAWAAASDHFSPNAPLQFSFKRNSVNAVSVGAYHHLPVALHVPREAERRAGRQSPRGPSRAELIRAEASRADLIRSEPSRSDPIRSDPSQAAQAAGLSGGCRSRHGAEVGARLVVLLPGARGRRQGGRAGEVSNKGTRRF